MGFRVLGLVVMRKWSGLRGDVVGRPEWRRSRPIGSAASAASKEYRKTSKNNQKQFKIML